MPGIGRRALGEAPNEFFDNNQDEFTLNPKGLIGTGRNAERLSAADQAARDAANGKRQTLNLPQRPVKRASLVEIENQEEFLEFHWNPSTYSITKQANWATTSVTGGTSTVGWTGCGLTQVSFELLLNDNMPHHATQHTVENSLQWLFDRLRPRSEDQVSRRTNTDRRGVPWLQGHDPASPQAPPILALFGLSRPFPCVLTDVKVTTIFQGPWGLNAAQEEKFLDASAVDSASLGLLDLITRATVQISLLEYIGDPSDGTE